MFALAFLKSYAKEIAILVAISLILGWAYHTIYEIGYKASNDHWRAKFEEIEAKRDAQIEQIEKSSIKMIELQLLATDKTAKDIRGIKLPSGTTTTIIQGKDCYPSKDFVDAYNTAITRGNKQGDK
jgi:hypothetical protein